MLYYCTDVTIPMNEEDIKIGDYWDPRKSLAAISVLAGFGLIVVLLQALQVGTVSGIISQSAIMISVSGAALMLGGLGGFLFGIPRRLQGDTTNKPAKFEEGENSGETVIYEGNTNLEQISDWLTKIIVGVTLVKLADIVTELEKYGGNISSATGRPSDSAFSVGVMVFFFICGFLIGYLWSRLFLGRALTEAESKRRLQRTLSKLQQQAQADAAAIGLARRQLALQEPAQSIEEIEKALREATDETISHIFSLAENNRWRNWESNKEQMERSIPVFEALVRMDNSRKYHRNLGQLAYCLKDMRNPDYVRSDVLFSRAITSRGRAEEHGWAGYEANRAIVRIRNFDEALKNFESADKLNTAILEDIRVGLKDYWIARWLKYEKEVVEWAKKYAIEIPASTIEPG